MSIGEKSAAAGIEQHAVVNLEGGVALVKVDAGERGNGGQRTVADAGHAGGNTDAGNQCARECLGTDRGQVAGQHDVTAELAVLKCALADRRQRTRESDGCQSGVVEGDGADAGYSIAHGHTPQVVATVEHTLLDDGDAGGNVDTGQRGAASKGTDADARHDVALGKSDGSQCGTALERGALDGCGLATDDQGLESAHVVEGLFVVLIFAGVNIAAHIDVLDAVDGASGLRTVAEHVDFHLNRVRTVGNNQSLQVRAARKFLADGLVPTRHDGDFFKVGATLEHTAAYCGGCSGNRADFQRSTAGK